MSIAAQNSALPGHTLRGVQLADGQVTDLHLAGGQVVDQAPAGATVIDADGLIALPGLVDPHTHLRQPGQEEAETVASGTAAAARGGFTAVCAMANTDPVTDTAARAEHVLALGQGAAAQVVPIGAISQGLAGSQLSDIASMHASGARVTMFSDDGKCVPTAGLVRAAMEQIARFDGVLAEHCQDASLAGASACCDEGPVSAELNLPGWPSIAESTIIARDAQIAAYLGARVHICHVSTAEGVEVLRWAKQRGVRITAEVTAHHLLLDSSRLRTRDTTFKVNPPLRSREDVEAVRQALAEGVIDMVGTDHAPHRAADKAQPFPAAKPGMLALEQALACVIETMVNPGRLDWAGVATRMSQAPAALAGLTGQGQALVPGAPATLVLIDPSARAVVDPEASVSLSRNNPYAGLDLPDPVVATWWAGRQTFAR